MQRTTLKLKINGKCVNKCRFCLFHDDPQRLEVKDIDHFFSMINNYAFNTIVINGGEPTIHPRFLEICEYLKTRFKNRCRLALGTNLIPWHFKKGKYAQLQDTIFETFDGIRVGCDDEHRNIEHLEYFAPIIVGAGLSLAVNVIREFCCEKTKKRILAVKKKHGINVTFSEIDHFYGSKPVINKSSKPCKKSARDLLINCNGDAFFCFHQEVEQPLFNLFTTSSEEVAFYLNEFEPEPYKFCSCCSHYRPVSEPFNPLQRLNGIIKTLKTKLRKQDVKTISTM
jgi:hypothetical protein